MNTIVIPVSKERPEDDILTLVDTFKTLFPDEILKVSDALVIETDIPAVAAIFKQIAGAEIKTNGNGKASTAQKYACIECGAATTKKNGRCRKCAMKQVALKKNGMRPVGEQLDE